MESSSVPWAVSLPFECGLSGDCTKIIILREQAWACGTTIISAAIKALSSPPTADTFTQGCQQQKCVEFVTQG